MSYETDVIRCKRAAIERIVCDRDLIFLIDPDFAESGDALIYQNIYPYLYVPQVEEKAKAYVTMGVDIPGLYDKNVLVKRVQVTLYAICHQDLMKTEFGAARTDCMAARLTALFNGSGGPWLGDLRLVSDTERRLDTVHTYRILDFETADENTEVVL